MRPEIQKRPTILESIRRAAAIGRYMMTPSLRRRLRVWEELGFIPPAGTNIGGVTKQRGL